MEFRRFFQKFRKHPESEHTLPQPLEQPEPEHTLPQPLEQPEVFYEKDRLTRTFRTWLDEFDNAFDENGLPEEVETKTDLYTMMSEFVALKNEVQRESSQFKNALDQYNSALELLKSGYETLNKEQRAVREESKIYKNELTQMALQMIIMEILDIHDRLEEGLRILKQRKPSFLKRIFGIKKNLLQSIIEGQEMILSRMDRMLLSHGVTPIETDDRILDPHCMRAVEVEYLSDREEGLVIEEIRKGFMLNGQILRVAEVKVNKGQKKDI